MAATETVFPDAYLGVPVLITGARGFLGTHLARHLIEAGANVHGVSRAVMEDAPGIRWWQSDLRHPDGVGRLLDDVAPGVVFHLAGHVTGDPALQQVLPTLESLLLTTINLLVAAASRGPGRVVLIGSTTEPPPGPDHPTPAAPYVAAKWAASAYGRLFHEAYGCPVVIARPAMTYGPGQPTRRLVSTVVRALLRGEAPHLSSGLLEADWTYVEDVVGGLSLAGLRPSVVGMTVDLGTGTTHTVREVVTRIVDIVRDGWGPCPSPIFGGVPDRGNERVYAAETETAARLLGWRAATSLADGLRLTVDWHARELGVQR